MKPIDSSAILQTMRVLREQAAGASGPRDAAVAAPAGPAGPAASPESFAALLRRSVDQVNTLQRDATGLAGSFEKGEPGVDIARVMVATQKARVAFEAMSQVRNHVVRAYQDVMNMPI